MTHHAPVRAANPAEQLVQLRQVLALVEELAGEEPSPCSAADCGNAYEHALPLHQRRFDRLAEETIAWSAAGVAALVAAEEKSGVPKAAAGRLASELRAALARLEDVLA